MRASNLMKNLVLTAAVLAGVAANVQAAPVLFNLGKGPQAGFGAEGIAKPSEDAPPTSWSFFEFSLQQNSKVAGGLDTLGWKSYAPRLDILSAVLVQGKPGADLMARLVDGTAFEQVSGQDWTVADTSGAERWSLLPGKTLTAGDWTLAVQYQAFGNKQPSAFRGELNATAVPEPHSLALSLLALAAGAAVLRKRKSV